LRKKKPSSRGLHPLINPREKIEDKRRGVSSYESLFLRVKEKRWGIFGIVMLEKKCFECLTLDAENLKD